MSNKSKRLFFALWPDEDIVRELHQLAVKQSEPYDGRATRLETIHMTLLFAGSVNQQEQQILEEQASEITASPFELVVDHLDYWQKPKVIWAGVKEIPESLQTIVSHLQQASKVAGLDCDLRFHPHVTLKRKSSGFTDVMPIKPIHWRVKDFVLVESKRHVDGVEYKVIRRWKLK